MSEPIIVEATMNANIDEAWVAITDKKLFKKWYFNIPDFELKEGHTFNFYEPGSEKKFHHQCTIKEIIAKKKLKHTWTHPSHSKGTSMITWQFEDLGGQTKVTLRHEGTEHFKDGGPMFYRESYAAGWDEIVKQNLKNFVESL